jgi:DNA replication protein DnaC
MDTTYEELREMCRELKLPTVAANALRLAEEAARQGLAPLAYLRELLAQEVAERKTRRTSRRIKEAAFPRLKTFDMFDFTRAPHLPETRLRRLADGDYIGKAEPIIFLGEPGTGKTHLATALGVAAAQGGYSVRFASAGALVTELVEAKDAQQLGRVVGRYARVDVLVLDELAYLPMARSDAELLFRVLGERHEQRATILTTNLPFGEWTSMFPDPRLCRAMLDRLTHRAHIIETGVRSHRLEEMLGQVQRAAGREPAAETRPARPGDTTAPLDGAP